jgi:hypothetical protein
VLGLGLGQVLATAQPQGTAVRAGAATLDLTKHTTAIVQGAPGTHGSLSVSCPEGIVVGGGFGTAGRNLGTTESRPNGIYAWRVSWTPTTADDTVVHACAVCMTTPTQGPDGVEQVGGPPDAQRPGDGAAAGGRDRRHAPRPRPGSRLSPLLRTGR